jgi:hypothetical protein
MSNVVILISFLTNVYINRRGSVSKSPTLVNEVNDVLTWQSFSRKPRNSLCRDVSAVA